MSLSKLQVLVRPPRPALCALAAVAVLAGCATVSPRGTGDLGVVIERAAGAVQVIDTSTRRAIARVDGLGDLTTASVVYSRDERYAYVFGHDGGLTKVDLLRARIDKRVVQAGDAAAGAISQDGGLIAVASLRPGGLRVFDALTLAPVVDIPAVYGRAGARSRVVGLIDAPGDRFVFSLYDAGEIWVVDVHDRSRFTVRKFRDVGKQPYDGIVTPDGRYYIAGLYGEDGLALLDLWNLDAGVRRILPRYGRGEEKLPLQKMPRLDYWSIGNDRAYVPAVGRREVLVIDMHDWREAGRVAVAGQPVFVIARPDGRELWVNFAPPDDDRVQVIDVLTRQVVRTLKPGKGVLHMEFTPRGEACWLSVRGENRVDVYDTASFTRVASLPVDKPDGIFFTARAHRIGQ
jgi:protein NirF